MKPQKYVSLSSKQAQIDPYQREGERKKKMAMARASSGLQYPERFYAAASYAGFDGSPRSSSKAVRSKFNSESALILYALYQQVPPSTASSIPFLSLFLSTSFLVWKLISIINPRFSIVLPVQCQFCGSSSFFTLEQHLRCSYFLFAIVLFCNFWLDFGATVWLICALTWFWLVMWLLILLVQ